MKKLILCFLLCSFSLPILAVDSFYCFYDERIHEKGAVNPRYLEQGCREIVLSDPHLLKVSSDSGKIKIEAIDDMFYVKNGDTLRLMYGPQTKLSHISFIKIDEESKKIIVVQKHADKGSLSLFDTEAVGNVTPRLFLESKTFAHVSQVEYLKETNELALISRQNKSIAIINDDADSRLEKENAKFKVKVNRFINGEKSQLKDPALVTVSAKSKKIYVLDSGRLLVFEEKVRGNSAPIKTLPAIGKEKAIGLRFNDEDGSLDFLHPKEKIPALQVE